MLITDFSWGHDDENLDYIEYGYAATEPDGANGFELGARFFSQVNGDYIYALEFPLGDNTSYTSVL